MEAKDEALDAKEREVAEVVSIEPASEARVADVALAEPGVVVARDGIAGAPLASVAAPESAPDYPQEDIPPHKNGQLKTVLQCMLFVSDRPLTSQELAENLQVDESCIEDALAALAADLNDAGGLQLARIAGGFQLSTRPEYADYCEMILQPAKRRLSKAALETLAVVAYRQPCTCPEIEAVRGVSVGGVLRTLMERGLVNEAGRKKTPGRPILYATTPEFLEYFGLNDLSELPDIDMLAVEEVRALETQRDSYKGLEADASGEVDPVSSDGLAVDEKEGATQEEDRLI